MLDTSLLIADERGKFDMPGFLRWFPSPQMLISAIAASELLHGIERARDLHLIRILSDEDVPSSVRSAMFIVTPAPDARPSSFRSGMFIAKMHC